MTSSPLSPSSLAEWGVFAAELADAARAVTTRYFRTAVPQEVKGDATPVTLADKETEETIRALIRARYPEHGILGEEAGQENAEADLCWVIDPIDGTRPFIVGIPTFVTLIALCHKGIPIIGVIDQPIIGERWVGIHGQKTVWTGSTASNISPASPEELSSAIIGTSDPTLFSESAAKAYRNLRSACAHQICGGDGYLYGRLASGAPHLVVEFGLKAHDFSALVPVIQGAGGVITDWQGNPLTIASKGDVLAAISPQMHQKALKKLQF